MPCPSLSRLVLRLAVSILMLLPCAPASSLAQETYSERLPPAVARALKQAGIPETAVAVVVQEAGATRAQVSLNAGQAFNPASLMKLLTTYAALDTLGPAYAWQTEILASRLPVAGVLDGDLVIRGGGDPKLGFEQFWLLLRQLRARGVREIRGDLLLDRSLFDAEKIAAAAATPFDDQPLRPYNVTPDALLVNYKTLRLQLLAEQGGKANQAPDLLVEPRPANLAILNRLRTTNATACGDWKAQLQAEYTEYIEDAGNGDTGSASPQLILSGDYPLNCGEQTWHLGAMSHAQYVHGVFRQLWQELGGTFSGRLALDKPLPAPLYPLARSESPPLAEIIRDINKYSNNVMARQLYLTLGAEWLRRNNLDQDERLHQTLRPASAADAARALSAWLAQRQLHFPELVLENGSGLSRQERLSANSLAALLQHAWQNPLMPEFIASLPLAGIDGTMKKRLQTGSAPGAGQAHIKTGSLDGVSAIAGYIRNRHGQWQIIVFLVNHPQAATAREAQDVLLRWVYDGDTLSTPRAGH
ncbi:D-alanyl-D-alanine carboxypeptidase/D-alanyl-D-alanine-endopeptidase [Sterolibacterium denitrificans]|uniref:D-alanyl-D-alanine carboxypeptidase/D-alanyl-D-alanine-endopeptidase n=1 Tax=Sterolibacterium denitrificans TaxID=157592 RepID=A0A7Z7MUU2_9PROT|nr:D-alanyl-D-alanine carboxypeptidase/D-alanyl-D-alanine-endopeptidase [Sterolibacterium denitrificans]SMB24093.1 D-alanyl-D-alanine carboxypeptidase/D-alanyl-D-alanine-endopeptidase [Sterolibacterium denitrificans]